MVSGGSDAVALKTNAATTGTPDPKTGPTTIPSTTRTPTTKPTISHMLESGNHQVNDSFAHVVIFCTSRDNIYELAILANPLALGFPSSGFPFLYYFFQSTDHYSPTL